MSVVEAPAIRDSLRGKLRDRVDDEVADEAITLLMDAMRSTKTATTYCKTCRTSVSVDVADARAASQAFETLIAHTEGKASTAQDAVDEALTVHRTTHARVDAAHALTLLDAGNLAALRLELVSSLPLDGGEPPEAGGGEQVPS